eukprot:11214523-Lingulodinium_polyedra.AAC.1
MAHVRQGILPMAEGHLQNLREHCMAQDAQGLVPTMLGDAAPILGRGQLGCAAPDDRAIQQGRHHILLGVLHAVGAQ